LLIYSKISFIHFYDSYKTTLEFDEELLKNIAIPARYKMAVII
jgi:hypothetical protein